jgi:transposase
MWFVGLDVHAKTIVVSVRSARGAVVLRAIVPTDASALRKVFRQLRGRVRVACEAGPLAPWIKSVLQTQLREVVVCHVQERSSKARPKSSFDADRLCEDLRTGAVSPVYVPQASCLELRRYLSHYVRMVRDRVRIRQRLNALFLESAVAVSCSRGSKRIPIRSLPRGAARLVGRTYVQQLESATRALDDARLLLIEAVSADPAFGLLQTIPYVGEIRAATLIAIIGTVHRFPGRRKFWSYGGLGVVQRVSAEHRIDENGRVVRDARTRGLRLAKGGHPLLRSVLIGIAVHAANGRGEMRQLYERHVARGLSKGVARLALARKIASVIIAVWRSGAPYNATMLQSV